MKIYSHDINVCYLSYIYESLSNYRNDITKRKRSNNSNIVYRFRFDCFTILLDYNKEANLFLCWIQVGFIVQ